MKRTNFLLLLLITLISLFSINRAITAEVSNIQLNMRTYSGVDIPAGVVIPVLNMQEISTETCPEGYKTKFVSTNDLYIEDTKVIPENSEFYGYIEKINEPIVGTNASMRVKIT